MNEKLTIALLVRVSQIHAYMGHKNEANLALSIVDLNIKKQKNEDELNSMVKKGVSVSMIKGVTDNIKLIDKSINIAAAEYMELTNVDRLLKTDGLSPKINQIMENAAREIQLLKQV